MLGNGALSLRIWQLRVVASLVPHQNPGLSASRTWSIRCNQTPFFGSRAEQDQALPVGFRRNSTPSSDGCLVASVTRDDPIAPMAAAQIDPEPLSSTATIPLASDRLPRPRQRTLQYDAIMKALALLPDAIQDSMPRVIVLTDQFRVRNVAEGVTYPYSCSLGSRPTGSIFPDSRAADLTSPAIRVRRGACRRAIRMSLPGQDSRVRCTRALRRPRGHRGPP
jgi:hypothetical protein